MNSDTDVLFGKLGQEGQLSNYIKEVSVQEYTSHLAKTYLRLGK